MAATLGTGRLVASGGSGYAWSRWGGLMIRSTEIPNIVGKPGWKRQGLSAQCWQHWLTGGIGIFLAACLDTTPQYELLMQWKWVGFIGITNVGLLAVMFFGTEDVWGALRWINILGFHVQPSEFCQAGG